MIKVFKKLFFPFTILFLIFIYFYVFPVLKDYNFKKKIEDRLRLNKLLSCVEESQKNILQEAYRICGIDNNKDCPFPTLLNAIWEGKYQKEKNVCINKFYSNNDRYKK